MHDAIRAQPHPMRYNRRLVDQSAIVHADIAVHAHADSIILSHCSHFAAQSTMYCFLSALPRKWSITRSVIG